MTTTREALVLPLLFLTVALLGGLRVAAAVTLLPPSLISVVLGILLVGALVRGGVLVPASTVGSHRTPLENMSGAVVVASLLAASSQVFNLVTPDTGLLHLLFACFFFIELLTTIAGASGPRQLLRSIGVLLAGAFVLRWIVLESLYAPGAGTAKRLLTLLLEGVSLGSLDYRPSAPVTGYVALLTLALYLAGLVLLVSPRRRNPAIVVVQPRGGALVLLVLAAALACAGCGRPAADGPGLAPHHEGDSDKGRAARIRDEALRGARVWRAPAVPVSRANLADNPPGPGRFGVDAEVTCRFLPKAVGGTSPKFDCELPGGEVIRVKYGTANPEVHAEVAATRLLGALGFPSDQMSVVRRVRCLGCPEFPYQALECLARTGLESACFPGGIDYARPVDFDPAAIERRHTGAKIEAFKDQGWAWFELDQVDPARGGSPPAEVDALRLMAVILAHWDNKAENQRLVCASEDPGAGRCRQPFAIIQDLGATFGPLKVDFANWQRTPVWSDPATCTVSMESLPYKGGTFPTRRISEGGRRLLLRLLQQLSDAQLTDLFTASRITSYDQVTAAARGAAPWVSTFKDKVRQIREAGPCGE